MLEIRATRSCPECGAIWRKSTTIPAAMLCESVELDRMAAWVCLECSSWWRLSDPTLDLYADAELARLTNLDASRLRGASRA